MPIAPISIAARLRRPTFLSIWFAAIAHPGYACPDVSGPQTPTGSDAEVIGTPLELPNGQRIRNRLLKSAMSEAMADRHGHAPASMQSLYGRWADGGLGLSVTGNVMIDGRALGEPGNVVLEDERDLEALRAWAQAGQRGGARIYMQLNHPGRQCPKFLNRESVAPSAVPFKKDMQALFATPRALEPAEIEALVERFGRAAGIAEKAGFDGVQIHGAHGYLVSQFLSPHTNLREDDWGGTAEKRRRFVHEVYRAMRAHTSEGFGVAIKINSADFQKSGIDEQESTETIVALAEAGMDFVEVSGGTYEAPAMMGVRKVKDSTRRREAYFLAFAEELRAHMRQPLVVTGGFRTRPAMAEALRSGAIDMVGMARPLALDPDFPLRLLEDEGEPSIETPPRRTGIKALDRLGMIELTWYEQQLHRMGEGKEPKPNMSPLLSAAGTLLSQGFRGFRTRRAR